MVRQPLSILRTKVSMQILRLRILGFVFAGSLLAQGQGVEVNPAKQTPLAAQSSSTSIKPYHSITGRQRLSWFLDSTLGPQTLAVGLVNPGIGTARDAPPEYGSHWAGFGERYGMGLTGVATGNAMEASVGAVWGEDPRYFRTYRQPFKGRVRNVVVMTFLAHNRQGALMPAYARYGATAGNNFLSNTGGRTATPSFAPSTDSPGKNAFIEFWPDIKTRVFRKKD